MIASTRKKLYVNTFPIRYANLRDYPVHFDHYVVLVPRRIHPLLLLLLLFRPAFEQHLISLLTVAVNSRLKTENMRRVDKGKSFNKYELKIKIIINNKAIFL